MAPKLTDMKQTTGKLIAIKKVVGPGAGWLAASLMAVGVLFGACARPGTPSGGPPDRIPPMVASTWPDTFAVIEPTRDPVKIVYSERISERPTQGTLAQAVLVSPVTGEHRVKHTRSGLEVEVIGGFKPGLVYRVRVLPTVKDLFNNPMEGPFELVFSTGADFERNVVAGIVTDRVTGDEVEGARVEARGRGEDPPVYVAVTDSAGVFALRFLPAGSYDLSLYEDVNRNAEPDFAELQGTSESTLAAEPPLADTVILREVRLLRPDTLPARLIRVEAMDSVLIRLAFDDFLDAEGSLDSVQARIALEDGSSERGVDRLLWPREVDSLRVVWDSIAAEERRLAQMDSLRVLADSVQGLLAGFEAAGDTLGVDSLAPVLDLIRDRMEPPEPEEEPEETEDQPPPPILPKAEFYILLLEPLLPDQLFQATVAGVVNLNGLPGGGGESSFTWEPPEREPEEEPDSSAAVPDTAGVVPDTTGALPDSAVVRPDTTAALPDSTVVRPDTIRSMPFRPSGPLERHFP